MNERFIRFLVTCLLPAFFIGWLVLVLVNRPMVRSLTREDGFIQNLQVIFLVAAAYFCLRIAINARQSVSHKLAKPVFQACLILTLIVIFEELSWGQRILGFETPEAIKQLNAQNELTLHNLEVVQRFRHLLLLIFGLVGLTLIQLQSRAKATDRSLLLFAPPGYFRLAFGLILLCGIIRELAYMLLYFSSEPALKGFEFWLAGFVEIGELSVAITAFAYAAYFKIFLISRKPAPV